METVKNLPLRKKMIVTRDLGLLLESRPRDDYQKVPVTTEAQKLLSEAIQECIRNGLTPDCAVDGEGGASSEITSINEFEFIDLLNKLKKIEDRQTSK